MKEQSSLYKGFHCFFVLPLSSAPFKKPELLSLDLSRLPVASGC